jgi:multidrug resistance efflux pump
MFQQEPQLMYLIPQQTWVIANFKETQIADMRIGQKASFTVDAMKHQKFTGHVEQISPAAGAEFSVLKPDNTTETSQSCTAYFSQDCD